MGLPNLLQLHFYLDVVYPQFTSTGVSAFDMIFCYRPIGIIVVPARVLQPQSLDLSTDHLGDVVSSCSAVGQFSRRVLMKICSKSKRIDEGHSAVLNGIFNLELYTLGEMTTTLSYSKGNF